MSTDQQLSASELAGIPWRTSTRSSDNGGQCVEAGPLADGSGRVAVRHSRHPEGSVIVYTRAEWTAFLAGAKDGEFDFTDLSSSAVRRRSNAELHVEIGLGRVQRGCEQLGGADGFAALHDLVRLARSGLKHRCEPLGACGLVGAGDRRSGPAGVEEVLGGCGADPTA